MPTTVTCYGRTGHWYCQTSCIKTALGSINCHSLGLSGNVTLETSHLGVQ